MLEDAQDIDHAVCLGDVVGYGGDPVRCLDEVRSRGWPTLVGNHDRACTDEHILSWFNADAAAAIRWTREQLDEERITWLRELPESAIENGVLLVHASPRGPIFEYILDRATAAANLELLGDGACLHGHTHVPGCFHHEGVRVAHSSGIGSIRIEGPVLINPGSVGQPRDGIPDASYGVWDVEAATFEWRRVPYDREGAKRAILAAGLPPRFAARLDLGR